VNQQQQQWTAVLSAASAPPPHPEAILPTAMQLGLGLVPSAAACSVTELTDSGYRTTVSANALALALDRAQYDAGEGPCLTAASLETVQRVNDMVEEPLFRAFRAAAVRRGVHSSLSLPLTGLRRPGALNLYASAPDAFAADRSRSVADLLARCVTRILSGDRPVSPAAAAGAVDAAVARRSQVEQALAELMASGRLSRTEAFTELIDRSRQHGRSIFDIVDDIRREEPS
jgi:hypothetical protein